MEEWFENERFWVDLYPFLFPEEKFQTAVEEIEKIIALTGFQGKRVLDLCCGPGRHTVVLAKKGYTVTAVDRSPFLLIKAQELAQAEGVSVEWVLEDMRNFVRPPDEIQKTRSEIKRFRPYPRISGRVPDPPHRNSCRGLLLSFQRTPGRVPK